MIQCLRFVEIILKKLCVLCVVLLVIMIFGSMRCLFRFFSRVGVLVVLDFFQGIRVELVLVRVVEVVQVVVYIQKIMMMICMVKWWWLVCSELVCLDFVFWGWGCLFRRGIRGVFIVCFIFQFEQFSYSLILDRGFLL